MGRKRRACEGEGRLEQEHQEEKEILIWKRKRNRGEEEDNIEITWSSESTLNCSVARRIEAGISRHGMIARGSGRKIDMQHGAVKGDGKYRKGKIIPLSE